MTNAHDLTTRLLALQVLKKRVEAISSELRAELKAVMSPGDRKVGSILPADLAAKPQKIGYALVTDPETSYKIDDAEALLRWAKKKVPGEVHAPEQIRSSFISVLLKSVKENGGWVDPGSGELEDVPGIVPNVSDPSLRVVPSPEADQIITQAVRQGLLDWSDVIEPPAIVVSASMKPCPDCGCAGDDHEPDCGIWIHVGAPGTIALSDPS